MFEAEKYLLENENAENGLIRMVACSAPGCPYIISVPRILIMDWSPKIPKLEKVSVKHCMLPA